MSLMHVHVCILCATCISFCTLRDSGDTVYIAVLFVSHVFYVNLHVYACIYTLVWGGIRMCVRVCMCKGMRV